MRDPQNAKYMKVMLTAVVLDPNGQLFDSYLVIVTIAHAIARLRYQSWHSLRTIRIENDLRCPIHRMRSGGKHSDLERTSDTRSNKTPKQRGGLCEAS